MSVDDRVLTRLTGEDADAAIIAELVTTAQDRIKLRVGYRESGFPAELETIAVDVVVKLWRRRYYEGITSESADTGNASFVDDVLSEYTPEFAEWRLSAATNLTQRTVRFL